MQLLRRFPLLRVWQLLLLAAFAVNSGGAVQAPQQAAALRGIAQVSSDKNGSHPLWRPRAGSSKGIDLRTHRRYASLASAASRKQPAAPAPSAGGAANASLWPAARQRKPETALWHQQAQARAVSGQGGTASATAEAVSPAKAPAEQAIAQAEKAPGRSPGGGGDLGGAAAGGNNAGNSTAAGPRDSAKRERVRDEDDAASGEDTVGSELRERQKGHFLGLPKLFWALFANVVAMALFVLCIPWILHFARRRRTGPAASSSSS